ncbi:MAG: hypothetical protein COA57_16150 [Flavobacteriales bacterium]|nr:class I SAM-dependent methyltransferase [Bacteroidales bacterium AH-315-I05]PCJ78471.1 MAG: hypothetical protein COA57_16150 [Flavobacteriales bacterium]
MTKTADKSYYSSGDFIGNFLRKQRHKNVLRHVKGELVDIACGDNYLVHEYGSGKGVDIKNYGNVDVVAEDLSNLPFDDQSIDTVTIIGSINYFKNPKEVLKETNRILKDDGLLILTTTNYFVMKMWHLLRESWAHKPGYTSKQLQAMITTAAFVIDKKIPFNFLLSNVYIVKKSKS